MWKVKTKVMPAIIGNCDPGKVVPTDSRSTRDLCSDELTARDCAELSEPSIPQVSGRKLKVEEDP